MYDIWSRTGTCNPLICEGEACMTFMMCVSGGGGVYHFFVMGLKDIFKVMLYKTFGGGNLVCPLWCVGLGGGEFIIIL